jgi:DNA-directed RNA polymerase beta' subunit
MMGLAPTLQALPQAAIELQKHIMEHVRLKAEEDTAAELFKQYGSDPDRMVSELQREAMISLKITENFQMVRDMQNGLTGQGGQPDPVVVLKEKEIALRAQEVQNKAQEGQARLNLDAQKVQQTAAIAQQRIASQEKIAGARAETARERIAANDLSQRRRDRANQERPQSTRRQ